MTGATPGESICQEQEAKTKFVGVHPSPCSARGDLCLCPPGPRGGRLGGLFTFNLAMKLTPGAWEREESFQLGGSPGCQSLAKVLASRADRYRPSPDGKTAPLFPALTSSIPPVCDHTTHQRRPPRFRSKVWWADSRTERHMHLQGHPAPSHRAPHTQATRLPGRPAHRFHFISASLLLDSQKRRCSAAASLLLKPLGTWSFPVPLRENLCPAKLPVHWFCKPRSALETPGFL